MQSIKNKNKHIVAENRSVVTRGAGGGRESKMSKGGQLYGDRWKQDFWW